MHKLTILSIKNSRWIHSWTKQFCNSTMLAAANIRKNKGSGVSQLLRLFLSLPFCDLAVWRLTGSQQPVPGRDAFYRFLSNPAYNWGRLLSEASGSLISELNRLTGKTNDRVLIIDDSPCQRPRSNAVELLGSQYDHSTGSYYRGFRLLAAGWSDGHSFVPTTMELLTNSDRNKRVGPDPDLDGRTHAATRSKQATRKATDLTLEMVRQCNDQQLPIDYVVFDSWFAQPALLHQIHNHVPVVCMLKRHPNLLYKHGKHIYTLTRLHSVVAARRRSKADGPIIGSICVQMLGGPTLRVVFIRDERDRSKWLALASSDVDLSPQRICRIYAKRWAIEVFFKQTKQYLGLTGELQVRRYTACVAFTTIVFLRYMMLCYYHRQQSDDKTIPGLFYQACQQLQAMALHCCLQIVLLEILIMMSKSGNPEAFHLACSICGIVEKFTANLQNRSFNFQPLQVNCES